MIENNGNDDDFDKSEQILDNSSNIDTGKKVENFEVMPVVPLRGMVIFPSMILHFDISRLKSIAALEESMKKSQPIFVVSQKDINSIEPGEKDIYRIGIKAKVKQIIHHSGGLGKALIEGVSRVSLVSIIENKTFIKAMVKPFIEIPCEKSIKNKALFRKARDMFVEYLRMCAKAPVDLALGAHTIKNSGQLADFIASNVPFEIEDKQKILEEPDQSKRLEEVMFMLSNEFNILKIENDLAIKLKNKAEKHQKEYFLREQIKVISEELGETDDPSQDVKKYIKRIKELKLSKENTQKLTEEVNRFAMIPLVSGESSVFRNYIDFCLSMPWNKLTSYSLDISKAQKVLDKGHYGLKDVKDRIIEFLASYKLAKKTGNQILCLIGPPGVGKTSIIESLAKAMKRKYARISLGGVNDESEIRGHRKTYIGAMPGRIISSLKKLEVRNPVILLDEIDKLSKDWHGDPYSALLEALDPEQNKKFYDHYLDLDFDLSEVFFVATANDKSQIPVPLYDRMEIIELCSYTYEEKFVIAKNHLISKQMAKNGLSSKTFLITSSAIKEIIESYTREAGVRELERKLASLMRKTAKKIVTNKNIKKVKITKENLIDELGPHKYKKEENILSEVGVVRGLAWTAIGGETMPIEVSLMKGKGKIDITGSLGDVMKESARIALSYIRSNAVKLGINENFYNNYDIHIHAPEGAVPKDGPSAGITMTTALVSALTKVPVRQDLAMTGEITLKGRVLPIGGLKEKTMAAYRAGVKTIVIPEGNKSDLMNIDNKIKDSINFITAENLDVVFKTALINKI